MHVFLEIGVLPAMVTPVVEPEGESAMTPAKYPVPPIPELSLVVSDPLEAVSPAGPPVGSPARDESLLAQISPSGSVAQAFSSPKSTVLRSTPDDSPIIIVNFDASQTIAHIYKLDSQIIDCIISFIKEIVGIRTTVQTRQSEMADLARRATRCCRYYIPLHFDTNPESLRPFVPEIWPNNVFNLSATYDLDL